MTADDDPLPQQVRALITAAVAALDPTDRAERIAHCQQTGQHGVRMFTDPDGLLDFQWGGRRLAMIRAADLLGDGLLSAEFVPDTVPDTVPEEWGQP